MPPPPFFQIRFFDIKLVSFESPSLSNLEHEKKQFENSSGKILWGSNVEVQPHPTFGFTAIPQDRKTASKTARPQDRKTVHSRKTARPQGRSQPFRKTARPQDRKTARLLEGFTAIPQDRKTARSVHSHSARPQDPQGYGRTKFLNFSCGLNSCSILFFKPDLKSS